MDAQLELQASGKFSGQGRFSRGYPTVRPLNGRWDYDTRSKVLTIELTINGVRQPTAHLDIAGKNGRYEFTSGLGWRYDLVRA